MAVYKQYDHSEHLKQGLTENNKKLNEVDKNVNQKRRYFKQISKRCATHRDKDFSKSKLSVDIQNKQN